MTIVQKHGRKPYYNFYTDPKLQTILNGVSSPCQKNNKNYITCAFDSFLTIWLLTLPEKFKQWYKISNINNDKGFQKTTKMDMTQRPSFPRFEQDSDNTKLSHHSLTLGYNYLPDSWKLVPSFDYYLMQREKWTTKSIEDEWLSNTSIEKPAQLKDDLFPTSSDEDPQEDKEGETNKDKEEEEVAEFEFNNNAHSPIEQQPSNSPIEQQPKEKKNVARAVRQDDRKRSSTENYLGQQGHTKKRKRRKQIEMIKRTQVNAAQASELIFKFAPAVSSCTLMLEQLIPLLKKKHTINLAEDIRHKMGEIATIKTKLLDFARENMK
jgi:hypothetical protein